MSEDDGTKQSLSGTPFVVGLGHIAHLSADTVVRRLARLMYDGGSVPRMYIVADEAAGRELTTSLLPRVRDPFADVKLVGVRESIEDDPPAK